MRTWFAVRACGVAWASIAALGAGALEVSRPSAPAVYVSQFVDGTARAAATTLSIRVGYPVTLRGAGPSSYSIEAASRDPATFGFSGLQIDLGTAPLDAATLQQRADTAVAAGWPALQARLQTLMQAVGASFAFFTFGERVAVAGDRRALYLTFVATVDGAGRANHGTPQLRATSPVFVQLTYTPLRASAEVSHEWAYPDGGVLRWHLVDARLQPIGAETAVQTRGAFDDPESVEGASPVAPLAGLACLIDRSRGGCAGAPIDVRALLTRTGAEGALVDYRQRVRPHCVERAYGSGGVVCERAVEAVDVASRTLSFGAGCGRAVAVYRNTGAATQTLEASVDRYWVDARGALPRRIASRQDLIPTGRRSYDRQVELPAATAAAVAGSMIVNPLGDVPALVPIDEGATALRTLAPLRTDFTPAMVTCR